MEPIKSPYIRDFKLPAAASGPAQPPATETPVKTELVDDIPVKAQDAEAQASNPIANTPAASVNAEPENDKTFDQVLKDVNREVKKQSTEPDNKKPGRGLKKGDRKAGPQPISTKPHFLPIAVAVIVTIALAFIAFSALKKSGGA